MKFKLFKKLFKVNKINNVVMHAQFFAYNELLCANGKG